MDLELATLVAMLVAVLVIGARQHSATRSRPGHPYQRVISFTAIGLLFLVSGLLGWDLSYSHGWFKGTRWVAGTVWWQVGLGLALLVAAGVSARRLPSGASSHVS